MHTQRLLALVVLFTLVTGVAIADSVVPTIPVDGTVSSEQIETAIVAVEALDALDDDTRATVVDQLRDARAQIQYKLAAEATTADFIEAINTAPTETERLRRQLDADDTRPPDLASLGIRENMALQELEQMVAREVAELAGAESRLADVESQVTSLEERPAVARQRIVEIRGDREELSVLIDTEPAPDEPPILTDARKLDAALKRDALIAELQRLDQELLSHSVRSELLQAQRDVAAREAVDLRRRVELLQTQANEKRQASVQQSQIDTAEAEIAAADKHPAVLAIAQGNAALTKELPTIAADIERATSELNQIERKALQVEQSLARSQQYLEVGGSTQAIGWLLVDERRNLPGLSEYRTEVRVRQKTVSRIGLAQLQIEEQRRELTQVATVVENTLQEVLLDITEGPELDSIRGEVTELLNDRRTLLNQAQSIYSSYLQVLGNLNLAQRRLEDATTRYGQFLDEHLLWIPSATAISAKTLTNLDDALAWAFSPQSWAGTIGTLFQSTRENPVGSVAALLLLGILILSRRPLAARYGKINSRVGNLSTDHIGLTIGALFIIAIHSLPLPLFFAIVGWTLTRNPLSPEFSTVVATALIGLAPFLYNLQVLRALCAQNGVGHAHFGWPDKSLAIIRQQLYRLMMVGTPILFITLLAYESPINAHRESLGRLAIVAIMVLIAVVVRPIGDPMSGAAAAYYKRRPGSWASRLKWLWFGLEVGTPLALALLAVFGYLFTAIALTNRLADTLWLALVIFVANLVVVRWLALAHRKLAWQMALEQREALTAARRDAAEDDADGDIPVIEPDQLDLDAVSQQTRRLLRVGMVFVGIIVGWGIWSDMLPALSILEQISLWSQTITVDGVATIVPVTLADLLLAFVVAGVAVVASRNLPGLLEIAVFEQFDLARSSRYTISTLLGYLIVIIAVISVLSIIGWNWGRIQWLVAALSVGLGFGLQEIVANFIAGLIILFERPVRVGDTVTVGQLTGTVSRVRMRATTITDWDRKEIIVPNKSFITEQVINWTLNDAITRVVVPVKIGYGSDVELATQVMEDTLHSMPLVLPEPPPKVYFMEFGDSSLDFNLYVYSKQLADRLPLMHAVHEKILGALRDNGIEIPFPQRDVHLQSMSDDVKK